MPPPPSSTPPPPHTPIFLRRKKKKASKGKKERVSKLQLLKGCHQGQAFTVLAIPERLDFKVFFLSVNHGGRQYFLVFHDPLHVEIHFVHLVFHTCFSSSLYKNQK